MDPVTDERGQALVIAVFAIAIVAAVISGLRVAQDRVLAHQEQRRAGEAAVEAATAAVADAYLAEIRRVAASTSSPPPPPDILGALTSAATREAARAAGSDVAVANGAAPIDEVTVRCDKSLVEVALLIAGVAYRAGFAVDACYPH
jgi:predicted lipid-binding transport protein (Tim44 family)